MHSPHNYSQPETNISDSNTPLSLGPPSLHGWQLKSKSNYLVLLFKELLEAEIILLK